MKKTIAMLWIILIPAIFSCKKTIENKVDNDSKISQQHFQDLYRQASALSKQKSIKLATVETDKKLNLVDPNNPNNPGNPPTVTFSEPAAIQIVEPLIDPTAAYILQKYDINVYEYFSPGDPRIAEVGLAAARIEQLQEQGMTIDTNWSVTNYAVASTGGNKKVFKVDTNDPDIYDCALRAVGITAVVELFQAGISGAAKGLIAKKALRKAITKIASRSLGFIGAAVAIYEFGDCMEAW